MALRHQLAEMLLTDVIGISWSKAHDEAERLEHAISPEIEALLLKRFADKESCPHGLPLRGGVTQLRKQGAVLLSDLQANDRAAIVCVYERTLNSWSSSTTCISIPARNSPSPAANTMKRSRSVPPTAPCTSPSPRLPAFGSAVFPPDSRFCDGRLLLVRCIDDAVAGLHRQPRLVRHRAQFVRDIDGKEVAALFSVPSP